MKQLVQNFDHIVALSPYKSPGLNQSGEPLIVDVEFGRGHRLYALSQGPGQLGAPDGAPAVPNTGALVKVNDNGTFTVVVEGLDQPTSLEFIGNTAYVVTYGGEIWKIDGIAGPRGRN